MITGQEKVIKVVKCDEQIVRHLVIAKLTIW